MKKVNRNILNAVLVGAGFLSSLLMINKNKVITKVKLSLFSKAMHHIYLRIAVVWL